MCAQAAGGVKKLGIIAGSGRMPALLIEACEQQGRPYFVLGLEGHSESEVLANAPHKIVRLGAVGDALKTLKKEQVEEVIMAGHVGRPTLASLRPDMTATMLIAKMGASIFSGDDALLGAIITIMEKEGMKVVGMQDVLAHLVTKEGVLGKCKPTKQQLDDIARGMSVVKMLGELDIGQAVVVENNYVLGVEAAEGTDGLLARCAALSQHEAKHGVLVKAKKPAQDTRVDLPTIGKDTIQRAIDGKFAGIALEAGGSILLDQEETIRLADAHSLFVVGVTHG